MADTLQFDLVSPERILSSVQATQVQIPGAEGDMTALPDHAPVITTLRPGLVRVSSPEGDAEYVVTGGFAEIGGSSVSVLAERAVPRDELSQESFKELLAHAKAKLDKAKEVYVNEPGPVDDAAKLLEDMVAVGDEIGLGSG
ncbi:MAG: F0F1 ATP synthase subunit epsilon [Pseudomonadota bacterium]